MFGFLRRNKKNESSPPITSSSVATSQQETRYVNTPTEELLKLWDNESRRYLQGNGKYMDGAHRCWFVGIDYDLVTELEKRKVSFGRANDFGVYNPRIPAEELNRFKKETMAILEKRENRFVVIDTCTPEELNLRLRDYRRRPNIYYTPHNHTRPDTVYGPLPLDPQLALSL